MKLIKYIFAHHKLQKNIILPLPFQIPFHKQSLKTSTLINHVFKDPKIHIFHKYMFLELSISVLCSYPTGSYHTAFLRHTAAFSSLVF